MIGALLPIVLQLLPGLASAVAGGKGPDIGETASKVARAVLGTDDPAKVAEAIKTPAQAEAFKAQLEADTAQFQAVLADVQDARKQTVELAKAGSPIAWGAMIVSIIVTLGFVAMTGVMLFKAIPDSQASLMVFGTLSTAFGMVLNYWLGSSNGSRQKDATIAAVVSAGKGRGK